MIDLSYEIFKLIAPYQLLMALLSSYGVMLAITKFSAFVVTKIVEMTAADLHWPIGPLAQKNAEIFAKGAFINVVNGFGIGVLLMVVNAVTGPDLKLAWSSESFSLFLDVHWFLNIMGVLILIIGWTCVVFANVRAYFMFTGEQRFVTSAMARSQP